tara:strand:+ start:336 stop:524 length:189 start_codon:yes stop_codon:yes gene_type:complete
VVNQFLVLHFDLAVDLREVYFLIHLDLLLVKIPHHQNRLDHHLYTQVILELLDFHHLHHQQM